MSSRLFLRLWIGLFVLVFFAYLFGPLILMSLTAFNSPSFPTATPWECFTWEWFGVLSRDEELIEGLRNSFIIGAGVVLLSVPIGLAAALVLTQLRPRVRPYYYTIVISPILIPGVVLGISTLIFWDRLGTMFDASYDSVFYDGFFLTIVGQTTFISAYTMLVFISRLQRFDPAQEEAALDLGATHVQAFRKILLPFLKPAIGSAAVLAFLASFENYNTTVFTIVSEKTLTTVLAGKVRYGINPSISALAVVIVGLTLIGAVIHDMLRRREQARELGLPRPQQARAMANPALLLLGLVFVAGLGTTWLNVSGYNVQACKVEVTEQKRRAAELRAERLRQQQMFRQSEPGRTAPSSTQPPARAPRSPSDTGNIFAPPGQSAPSDDSPSAVDSPAQPGIFDPSTLQPGSEPSGEPDSQPSGDSGIFDPSTLQPQGGGTD